MMYFIHIQFYFKIIVGLLWVWFVHPPLIKRVSPWLLSRHGSLQIGSFTVTLRLEFCETVFLRIWEIVLSESLFDNILIFFRFLKKGFWSYNSCMDLFPQSSFYIEDFYGLERLKIRNIYILENYVPSVFPQNSSCKLVTSLFSPFPPSCTYM